MCPCFRDAREPWEVFGGCRKRGVAWGSWTEIKIHHGRGQGGAAGRGGGAGRVPEGRKGQLQSVWSTNTLSLQRKILSFLRRLKSRVIIKGDPAARVCRIHLQGGLVVCSNSQGRCLKFYHLLKIVEIRLRGLQLVKPHSGSFVALSPRHCRCVERNRLLLHGP